MSANRVQLAVDIGGTFTDVALETPAGLTSCKVLTTPTAPEKAVLDGVGQVLAQAGVSAGEVDLIIHGTTLATNTIIERKGAATAMLVTEGFRDSVEMGYEHRFEQYDIYIDKPKPLVPRYLRLPVTERVSARGEVLIPLDEASVAAQIPVLKQHGITSVAVALIHAYANPAHEQRVGELLQAALPDVRITLSSDVCPEIREYERMSTAAANAYVQPLMARYLNELAGAFRAQGFKCPLYLMTSGGGLTTVETAIRHPIRLVESGPAGGAILACRIAEECGLDQVLSYDMGGTTAKVCLIDHGKPQSSRTFEVDRQYRFTKGSGLPVRIPVIEMVEIGAGGGSLAQVDTLGRIQVGPESAGSEPGPACYGRGGTAPAVTDADVVQGKISPESFAGGTVALQPELSAEALERAIGSKLNLTRPLAAFAVSEVVDENMSNAARVHAVEQGKDVSARALVAFGGAAPLHACRIAEKLGLDRIVVPTGAGVGSAIGFLCAPVSYEVVRSRYLRLDQFDPAAVNALLAEMQAEARAIVEAGAPGKSLTETRLAYMRYVGQGHEITVELPLRDLQAGDEKTLKQAFDAAYAATFGRTIPNMTVEILTWSVTVASETPSATVAAPVQEVPAGEPESRRALFDADSTDYVDVPVYRRDKLAPGALVRGPALIVEDQTTTVISRHFDALLNGLGYIDMRRKQGQEG